MTDAERKEQAQKIADEVSDEFRERVEEIMVRPICLISGRPIDDWAYEAMKRKAKP